VRYPSGLEGLPLRFLLLLLIAFPNFAAEKTPLTIEDYVTIESISAPSISPDGRRVAYVVSVPNLPESSHDADVWIAHLDGEPRARKLTSSPKTDNAPHWSPDGRTLTFLSDREGATQLYSIDPDGGEPVRLTNEKSGVRDYEWSPDGRSIALTMRDAFTPDEEAKKKRRDDARVVGDVKHAHLHLLDLESGKIRQVTNGAFSIHLYGWTPDSKSIVLSRTTGTQLSDLFNTDLDVLDVASGNRRILVARKGLDTGPRVSPDGKWVAFATGKGRIDWAGDAHLAIIPFTGGEPRVISGEYNRNVGPHHWSPDAKRVYFAGPWNSTAQLFSIDIASSRLVNLTGFEGVIDEADFDPRNDRAVFVKQSMTESPELYVSSLTRFAPRKLTSRTERFASKQPGETKLIRWKNPKDGLEIEGLLTLPLGYQAGRKVPLLTFVHGGPSSYFDQKYFGYLFYIYPVHVFAARGYAVLRPNVRGSGAYGEPFRQANRGDWGGGDWSDLNAGIDKLIADGVADPERLGLMGWSYGGYMAAWGITQTNRFKAASIGAPVVDFFSFDSTSDIPGYLSSFLGGSAFERAELYRSRNPLTQMAKAKTPSLIQHGENDERVPFSQGLMLHQALKDLGVPVTMVAYPRSGHGPREPLLRRDVARRNIWWFAKWIEEDKRTFEEFWKE